MKSILISFVDFFLKQQASVISLVIWLHRILIAVEPLEFIFSFGYNTCSESNKNGMSTLVFNKFLSFYWLNYWRKEVNYLVLQCIYLREEYFAD